VTVPEYDVEFLGAEKCGEDILIARFERPVGYEFAPGQWFTLRLQTEAGSQTRTFSHCSAPRDDQLEMATRLSGSAFKIALARLSRGDVVRIAGPGGRLALPDGAPKVVFLAGGVGITPIRSMLRDAVQRDRRFTDAALFYGNRDAGCSPFLAEFEQMGSHGVRVVVCYERPPEGWLGESGFITAEIVRRHLDPSQGQLFVVTGPPAMVEAMEQVLDDLGVADERRLVERFGSAR
jgi:ferredoxin-NADP reductase